jgi:hypothetical protein
MEFGNREMAARSRSLDRWRSPLGAAGPRPPGSVVRRRKVASGGTRRIRRRCSRWSSGSAANTPIEIANWREPRLAGAKRADADEVRGSHFYESITL